MKNTKEFGIKWFYPIVIGIFSTAIWEAGKFLIKKLAENGNSIVRYWINLPYRLAGLPLLELLLVSLVLVVCLFPLYFWITRLIKSINAYNDAKYLEINGELPKREKANESNLTRIALLKKIGKKLIALSVFSIIFTLMVCAYTFQVVARPIVMRQQFTCNLDIIAPYTNQENILLLKSKWAMMESADDYAVIDEEITAIIDSNGLKKK